MMTSAESRDMGNRHVKDSGQEAKDLEDTTGKPSTPAPHVSEGLGAIWNRKRAKMKCSWDIFLKIFYYMFGLLTVLFSLASLAVNIISAMTYKVFSSEESGRVIGMVVLAICAGVALSTTIYSTFAIFVRKNGHLKAGASVFLCIAIIQIALSATVIKLTPDDEIAVIKYMRESFRLSKEDGRHAKIWSSLQAEMECCGVSSPDDYRDPRSAAFLAPDVPVSCCQGFDPKRSELVQEPLRSECNQKRNFYNVGCRHLVVEYLAHSASAILGVTIVLIILELLSIIALALLVIARKKTKNDLKKKKEKDVKLSTIEEGKSQDATACPASPKDSTITAKT